MNKLTKIQQENLEWYKKNLPDFLKNSDYRRKHMIVHDRTVQGVFDDFPDAVTFAKKKKLRFDECIIEQVIGKNDVVSFIFPFTIRSN